MICSNGNILSKSILLILVIIVTVSGKPLDNGEEDASTSKRFRFMIGAFDLTSGDRNFLYKNFLSNISFKHSYFNKFSEPIEVKFSFEAGLNLTSIAEYNYKETLNYSLHYSPYAQLGPEILLLPNTFLNVNIGLIGIFHEKGEGVLLFNEISMNYLIPISERFLIDCKTGITIPFPVYGLIGAGFFMVGISFS